MDQQQKYEKRIQYIKENNIVPDAEILMVKVCKILIPALSNKESTYCHYDFGTSNIFATNPITVFDPSPCYNNSYIDVGRSAQAFIARDRMESLKQFLDGYFNGDPYDEQVLAAAIILNILYKIPYIHKIKRFEDIGNYQQYLVKNSGVLE